MQPRAQAEALQLSSSIPLTFATSGTPADLTANPHCDGLDLALTSFTTARNRRDCSTTLTKMISMAENLRTTTTGPQSPLFPLSLPLHRDECFHAYLAAVSLLISVQSSKVSRSILDP